MAIHVTALVPEGRPLFSKVAYGVTTEDEYCPIAQMNSKSFVNLT